jgi:hypothetical protein
VLLAKKFKRQQGKAGGSHFANLPKIRSDNSNGAEYIYFSNRTLTRFIKGRIDGTTRKPKKLSESQNKGKSGIAEKPERPK